MKATAYTLRSRLGLTLLILGGLLSLLPRQAASEESVKVSLPEGFVLDQLYAVPRETQGSWVCLAKEKPGRLIASNQSGQLYRIQLKATGAPTVEPIELKIGGAQGLLYAFDSLYVVVNSYEGIPAGLYRVRDTNGDDKYDNVELLREINGGGEHGPHAVVLSPDQKSLYVVSGNHTTLTQMNRSYLSTTWKEDQLLPRHWDAGGHAVGILAPGGWIARTDPAGKDWTLISSGYRNSYDIAFNADGELFTYDSDMEWDIGAPWYRPTRVCQAVEGSEFGWRSGTGKWPASYPDSLPAVVDIGPGSPVGVTFGTGTKFPAQYQRALFLADWSYGNLYVAHLKPAGAGYTATFEKFAVGNPFPITDVVVGEDGNLYLTTGGRNTTSAFCRIRYTGKESTALVSGHDEEGKAARALRKQMAALCLEKRNDQAAIDLAWRYLGDPDRYLRYTARLVLESRDPNLWKARVAEVKDPQALLTLAVALARVSKSEAQGEIASVLRRLDFKTLPKAQQIDLLRAYGLLFARGGTPAPNVQAMTIAQVDGAYPSGDLELNRELCRLLVYLRAPHVIERTLDEMDHAPTQEQAIHFAFCLSALPYGWNDASRARYFAWYDKASTFRGGVSFAGFINNIRSEAVANMLDQDREKYRQLIERAPMAPSAESTPPRKVVKNWTTAEVVKLLESNPGNRDLARGARLFAEATCYRCHRFAGEGGITGPDLTGVGRRFDNLQLAESLTEPSKTVSDQYQSADFVLKDGRVISGKVINLFGNNVSVLTNMLEPSSLTNIDLSEVEERRKSPLSLMPNGLLDTFTDQEILDLAAYLRSGGAQEQASAK